MELINEEIEDKGYGTIATWTPQFKGKDLEYRTGPIKS